MRRVLLVLVSLLGAVSGCSRHDDTARETQVAASEPTTPPDIVFVSIDSLRPDHLGCYGYEKPTSPTIDRIAKQGVRFETALSTTSWTLPAHAAMFTGLYDTTHGVVDNGLVLGPEHVTLAEILQAAGWHTAGFYGGPYLDPVYGLAQGFDHYTSCMTALPDLGAEASARKVIAAQMLASHTDVTGPRTLAAVESWLAGVEEKQPFFLFLHLWDVHYDYIPPQEYVEMFDPDYTGTLDARGLPRNRAVRADMAPRDLEHLLALYDGEIRFTDDVLGKILAALEKKGRLDNTLLVLTADHGQEFFEHGGKGHQKTLFDEVVRVPLVVSWPGRIAPGVVDDQVRLIDLLPTIAALAGIEKRPIVQGRDLGPLLRGESLPPVSALMDLSVAPKKLSALRTHDFKLIESYQPVGTFGFDLALDPRETKELVSPEKRVLSTLRELEIEKRASLAWREKHGAQAEPVEVDADMQQRLKGLGYTGDDR